MTPEQYAEQALHGIQTCCEEMETEGVESAYLWLPDPDKPQEWLWTEEQDEGIPAYAVVVFTFDDLTETLSGYLEGYERHMASNARAVEAQMQPVIERAATGDEDAQAWLNTLMFS